MNPSATQRFRELVEGRLAGRKVDLIGFVDAVLSLVRDAGEIRCALAHEDGWRVTVDGQTCEIELLAARAKLRMVCARLSVLCSEAQDQPDFAYGGQGAIAAADGSGDRWRIVFKNTPGEHEFAITADQPQPCMVPPQEQAHNQRAAARDS